MGITINHLYQTKVEASSYQVNIDSTVTITVTLLDFNNAAIKSKSVTLTCDKGYFNGNSSTKSVTATTDVNGKITATWTASEWGLGTFSANNSKAQVKVSGWRTITSGVSSYGTLKVDEENRLCQFYYHRSNVSVGTGAWNNVIESNVIPAAYSTPGSISTGCYHTNVLQVYLRERTLYCSCNASNFSFNVSWNIFTWSY